MPTYRYVTSESMAAKYAHIGNPTLCGQTFVRPRVTEDLPLDRAMCPVCVRGAVGWGWITQAEADRLLGLGARVARILPPRRGAHQLVPLMIEGCSDREVALRLGISTRTVNRLVADAMKALGVRSRFQWGYVVGRAAAGSL
ncbi:MAG: helix-turn-helix transcriptional regulator [Mycobacteriaceae bacterium]|nr:helix-turn-helix transcriptional regulator [Mycobacteriaceae bacterium]